jgi:hypothetical protein
MGHVWQGFGADELSRWAEQAGLYDLRYHPLPADPVAKGPTLFAASARRPLRAKANSAASDTSSQRIPTKPVAAASARTSRITKTKAGARAGDSQLT